MNFLFKTNFPNAVRNLSTNPSVNNVMLIGRLGKDPKIYSKQSTKSSHEISKRIVFFLATNSYKGRHENGLPKYNTEWHRILVNDQRIVEFFEKENISKGDRICMNGELTYSKVNGSDATICAKDVIRLSNNEQINNDDDKPNNNIKHLSQYKKYLADIFVKAI